MTGGRAAPVLPPGLAHAFQLLAQAGAELRDDHQFPLHELRDELEHRDEIGAAGRQCDWLLLGLVDQPDQPDM